MHALVIVNQSHNFIETLISIRLVPLNGIAIVGDRH